MFTFSVTLVVDNLENWTALLAVTPDARGTCHSATQRASWTKKKKTEARAKRMIRAFNVSRRPNQTPFTV
jgi:hypothetical protein